MTDEERRMVEDVRLVDRQRTRAVAITYFLIGVVCTIALAQLTIWVKPAYAESPQTKQTKALQSIASSLKKLEVCGCK